MADATEVERRSGNRSLEPIRGQALTYGEAGKTFGFGFGLPERIEGDPLGCGCDEAFLAGCSAVMGNEVEADYQCSSGWHNYVVFTVAAVGARQQLKVDTNGNVTASEGFSAGDLEEY
jgi:hypothetical protein